MNVDRKPLPVVFCQKKNLKDFYVYSLTVNS